MYRAQHRVKRSRMEVFRGVALLLCLAVLIPSFCLGSIADTASSADDTVTVTVNYVYESNKAMVAQPYRAQITKGSEFKKTFGIPKLLNYSVPADKAEGLGSAVVLSKDDASGRYTLNFDLAAVNEDLTVTLYYVAGKAKYTVYHYYQNLENNDYTLGGEDGKTGIVELVGDIDAYTEAVAEIKPGFRCKGITQTTIAADGTTKVEIYYDRVYYTVTFDVNGGVNGPEPIYAKYGTTFDAKDIKEPTRKGYTFLGWNPLLSDEAAVTENITYKATWKPEHGQADYTIVIWGQNANDDEYSYLKSCEAWGNVGNEVTWNEDTLISHVHTDDCRELTCGKDEHTHSEACRTCGKQEHTHTAACCSVDEHTHSKECYGSDVGNSAISGSKGKPQNPKQGQVFVGIFGTYIYIGSTWYYYTGNTPTGNIAPFTCSKSEHAHGTDCRYNKCGFEEHIHTASCYICGKSEHTHDSACRILKCTIPDTPKYMRDIIPDSALWEYERSDTVTVNADGSTVLNVYFKRTVFTLKFRKAESNSNDFGTIVARWGKNISTEYEVVVSKAESSFWSKSRDASGPWTNYIGLMPQEDITYYRYKIDGAGKSTMTYYGEDLNGEYKEIFSVTFAGTDYTVTEEDRYQFEGFKYDHGTDIGANCNGAKFYYNRSEYSLIFYSASKNTADKEPRVKYETPLSFYDYTSTAKPSTVESDAVFVGWYLNPECTGERFDLSAHTMPPHDLALYAKWVNGLYRVRTYTDETFAVLYTYGGYGGVQENIEKYTLAEEPTAPTKDGYEFVGWFYRDGGVEKPFSFTMPIVRDYDLYPKFDELTTVEYTVHYYKAGTTEKIADDHINYVSVGTTVTEKAKMGAELNLLPADKQNKYYPTNTSTSVIISRFGQEIIFYYTEASTVKYTVYYQDADGNNLIPSVTKDTEYSTVTEQYVPIDNYAPRQHSITRNLTADPEQNIIIFVYDPTLTSLTIQKNGWNTADENQTYLFRIVGTDENTKNIDLTVTVHENAKTMVTDLPVGSYTVTEKSDWSWRYTPDSETKEINLTPVGETVVFDNSRTDEKWLDGGDWNVNVFGD